MAQLHRSRIGIVQPKARGVPQRAGVALRRTSAHPLTALAALPLRFLLGVLAGTAALLVRLLFGSQRSVRGYGRSGYPEMDHWMAGRRRDFDR